MQIIAELILGFILEILLPLAAELSLDILWRSLGEPFVAREKRNSFLAGAGYVLFGLMLGCFSVWLFPRSFVRSESLHGINLLITPLVSGLAMSALGKLRQRQGKTLLRLDSFVYGFLFAFAMALVRFVYTT